MTIRLAVSQHWQTVCRKWERFTEETSAKACSYRHMISLNTSGNLNIHNWKACELFSLKFTFRPFICFCSTMISISNVNALHFVGFFFAILLVRVEMIICHQLIISPLSHEQAQTDCVKMQSHLRAVSVRQVHAAFRIAYWHTTRNTSAIDRCGLSETGS